MRKDSHQSGTGSSSAGSLTDDELDRLMFPRSLVDGARIMEDRRKANRGNSDRRRSERAEVDASASLRLQSGIGVVGHLTNLSPDGCTISQTEGAFAVDDTVWFRVENLSPWRGTVRWVDDGKVGIKFEKPFYPALFELIVQSNKPVTCAKAA